MPVPDASSDAYAVLGVDRNADDKTIASAHRRLARRHHGGEQAAEKAGLIFDGRFGEREVERGNGRNMRHWKLSLR